MVVVMPFAYAYPWHAGIAGDKQRADFEKDLLTDLIPFVQSNYRVNTDRDNRALAGLSMGGGLTLAIGPRHLDTFSRLAVFSAGGGQNPEKTFADVAANAKNVNAQLRLFWMGVGTEDGALAGSKRTSDILTSAESSTSSKTSPGAHTWIVWRNTWTKSPRRFSQRRHSQSQGSTSSSVRGCACANPRIDEPHELYELYRIPPLVSVDHPD